MSIAEQVESPSPARFWLSRHQGLAEFGIVGGCLLIYFLIRGNVVNRPAVAFNHAADLIHLEQRLGIFWEAAWQQAIRSSAFQTQFWDDIYFWGHAPVIAVVGFWLYFRHRAHYALIRNAFLVSALVGIFIYAVYPVAPPRLMTPSGHAEYGIAAADAPDYGFEDTIRQYNQADYQAQSLEPFVNPFAAVPSLHFGWAFLLGLGIALGLRNRLGLILAIAVPTLTFFGIVFTANHFIMDAVVGLLVAGAGLVVALAIARVPTQARQRFTRRLGQLLPARQPEGEWAEQREQIEG